MTLVPRLMQLIRVQMRANAKTELTVPQFRILSRLFQYKSNHSELSDAIGVSMPSISRMVEALAKRGLVQRDRSTRDRRQVSLSLTPRGRAFHEEIRKQTQRHFASCFSELSRQEQRLFLQMFEELNGLFFKADSAD